MTIAQAIAACDRLHPNQFDAADKIKWLSELDGRIAGEIHASYEGMDAEFAGYAVDAPPDTPLLVGAPYDDIYVKYLSSQVDFYNNEADRYNNSAAMYNALWQAYAAHVARTRMPRQKAYIKVWR